MRQVKELNTVVADLKRLRDSEGSQLVHDEEFRKAVQVLEELTREGIMSRRKVFRAVSTITRMLCDQFLKRNGTR